jgi:hypothetical protein
LQTSSLHRTVEEAGIKETPPSSIVRFSFVLMPDLQISLLLWRRNNENAKIVLVPLKTCKVSCFDLKEVKHTVEVSAGSVYEAVAQALRIFRDNNWVEDIGHGQTPITVKVKHPEIEHMVRVQDFERWLEASPRSPAEMILKNRLRELLAKGN